MRAAVRQGLADYVPISLARVPKLMAIDRIPVDVALIQVSMPDEFGCVSRGLSVDVIPAAVARARLVIAVRCGADDRQALEQLCRYTTRPRCRPRPARSRAPRQAQTNHWTVCVRARHWATSACKPTSPGKWCPS